jgi:hypothetical protein
LSSATTGAQIVYDNTTGNLYFDPIAGENNANIQLHAQLLAILSNNGSPPTSLNPAKVYYDPPTSSLDQLVQAAAGTPLDGNNGAVASNVLGNTADTPWNHHQLAASTG